MCVCIHYVEPILPFERQSVEPREHAIFSILMIDECGRDNRWNDFSDRINDITDTKIRFGQGYSR